MADDNLLPPSRLVRWVFLGAVILFAVGLHFRWGVRVPPMSAAPAAPPAPPPAPPSPTTR
jgi:hypothetical protein